MTRHRRALAIVGMIALLVETMLATLVLALATPAAAAQPDDQLRLVAQTAVLRPGGRFSAQFRVAGAIGADEVQIDVFDRLSSRIVFAEQLRPGAELGAPAYTVDAVPVSELRDGNSGLITVRLRTRRPEDEGAGFPVTNRAGVYPIRFTLLSPEGDELGSTLTHMLVLPDQAEGEFPLLVAPYVELRAPLALQPNGESRLLTDAVERIDQFTTAFVNHPGIAASLVPTPETIDALAQSPDPEHQQLLTDLRAAVAGTPNAPREVVGGPYSPIDAEAWTNADLGGRLDFLLQEARRTLTTQLQLTAAPTGSVSTLQPTSTDRAAEFLGQHGVRRYIIDEERLTGLDPDVFPLSLTQPFELSSANNRRLGRAAVVDTDLHRFFGATDNPVLDAHTLLADLTMLALDRPAVARGIILRPPAGWPPDRDFLDIVLTGLERAPVLQGATVSDFFARIEPAKADGGAGLEGEDAGVLRRALTAAPLLAPQMGRYQDDLFLVGATLETYRSVVGRATTTVPVDALLRVSGTQGLTAAQRESYFDAVYAETDDLTNIIEGPSAQTVSITAREFDIPFEVTNKLDHPVQTVVVLDSDKLEFPNGAAFEVELPPGLTELSVPVRARASGDSILQVTVRSPDQSVQLGPTSQFTVRSTVFSGLGVIISVLALVVLLSWWARQIVKDYRDRKGG
ncbi:MAG: hypothetical protein HKN26_15075 [Acidimicrobiales bacterium]|nr:hypothetical protein [Acidimicrobiales bacterium]